MSPQRVRIATETLNKEYDFGTQLHIYADEQWSVVPAERVMVGQYLVHTDDQGKQTLSRVTDVEDQVRRTMLWLETEAHGLICMESTAPVTALCVEGPVTVQVADLQPGDAMINRDHNGELEVIRIVRLSDTKPTNQPAVQPTQKEDLEMSDNPTAALEARVAQLEETLIATNEVVTHLQRSIVELTADHMQRIFNDEVMIDSIAQRVLIAGANAIAHKAKSSKDRAPELVVVEGYVPGSLRVTLQDDTVLIEEQVEETQEWVTGEQMSEGMADPKIQQVFGDLLIAYGAEFGRAYYVIDSVMLDNFRAAAAQQAATVVKGVEDQVREVTAVRLTTSDPFGNQSTHEIAADQIVSVDGKDGQVVTVTALQLEAGQTIHVPRGEQVSKETVTAVEAVA